MGRRLAVLVLVLAGCVVQQRLMASAPQEQPSAGPPPADTTVAMKPGVAGGVTGPALTGARRPPYRIRTSDSFDVSFTFSPEFNQSLTVQPDGYVPMRGAGQVYAEGCTVPELQEAIRKAYAGILHEPEVTVILKDFDKPYFIAGGEVGKPGKYELRSDTSLTEALAIAGGLTPRAKHSQVVLFRRISNDTVESHLFNVKAMLRSQTLAEDAHLQPGDFLFVPQNAISKIRQYLPLSSLSLYANPAQF
jgi:polysaccharide export outer membrane protein